ncbi:TIGR04206 family protein [Halobacteriales archaeon Cl-PHB]
MARRILAILALAVVPWTVVANPEATTLVFPFGLFNPATGNFTNVFSFTFTYTRGIPPYLAAWPFGVTLYLLALGNVALGHLFDREDRRVTAGLLVLVGLTQLSVAWGFLLRPSYTAIPLGSLACWLVAWWVEWPAIRGTVLPTSR